MTLFIDNRELKSKIPDILKGMGVETSIVGLEIGDYVASGPMGSLCIERKSAKDYIKCIKDESLNNQLYQMSTNYRWSVLLIHDSPTEALFNTKMTRQTYFSYIAGSLIENSDLGCMGAVSVVNVENDYDCAYLIKTLYNKTITGDTVREPTARKVKVPESLQKLYALQRFPHLGPKRAKELKDELKTIRNIVNSSEEDFIKLPGFGKVMAKDIFRFVNEE